MKNARVNEDGSMTVDLRDWYDFAKWNYKNISKDDKPDDIKNKVLYNGIVFVNNRAYDQQQAQQIEPYMVNMPINITKEEIEELLKRYRKLR